MRATTSSSDRGWIIRPQNRELQSAVVKSTDANLGRSQSARPSNGEFGSTRSPKPVYASWGGRTIDRRWKIPWAAALVGAIQESSCSVRL